MNQNRCIKQLINKENYIKNLEIKLKNIYDAGFNEGYDEGFASGYDECHFDQKQLEIKCIDKYEEGFNAGQSEGYDEGFDAGYDEGCYTEGAE